MVKKNNLFKFQIHLYSYIFIFIRYGNSAINVKYKKMCVYSWFRDNLYYTEYFVAYKLFNYILLGYDFQIANREKWQLFF